MRPADGRAGIIPAAQKVDFGENLSPVMARLDRATRSGTVAPGMARSRASHDVEAAWRRVNLSGGWYESDRPRIERSTGREIWAHTPGGWAIGAAVASAGEKGKYLEQLRLAGGHIGAEYYRLMCPPGLSDEDYEVVRDIAIMEALHVKGWIDITISNEDPDAVRAEVVNYAALRKFFVAQLPSAPTQAA